MIKHAADEELAESVRRAVRGEEFGSPRVAANLALRRGTGAMRAHRELGSHDGAGHG